MGVDEWKTRLISAIREGRCSPGLLSWIGDTLLISVESGDIDDDDYSEIESLTQIDHTKQEGG